MSQAHHIDSEPQIRCLDAAHGPDFSLYQGDCVELAKQFPENSVDLIVYSPPFSNLYVYSDSERDMGNNSNDEKFFEHYMFLLAELYRMLRPGRVVAVHCKDLVDYKGRDGRAGLRDFPGELIRAHEAVGFKYHARATIWKCPVTEMQRTKAHGLLYKQLRTDSSFSRQGLAEYVLTFRKWADDGDARVVLVIHTENSFPLDQWQEWASPVWTTVDQTKVLNVQAAREDADSKHMCPLQLDVAERCVKLWSNRGDVVLSPFSGIGSEGYEAIRAERKFLGFELKSSYFKQSERNLRGAKSQSFLFDLSELQKYATSAQGMSDPVRVPSEEEDDLRRAHDSQADQIRRLEAENAKQRTAIAQLEEAPAKLERELDERHSEATKALKEEHEQVVEDLEEKVEELEKAVDRAKSDAADATVSAFHDFLREERLIPTGSENDVPFIVSNVQWRSKLLSAVEKATQ